MVLEEHWQGYIACRQPPAAIRLITARHTCGDVSSKRDADLPLLTCRLLAVAGWQGREKLVGLILQDACDEYCLRNCHLGITR